MESSSHYLLCRGRELHYLDFGPQDAPVVVAWHGLARNAHDMDVVAQHLAGRFRVICPDTIGRGLSAWSPDPAREYCLDFYVELAESLLDTLGISRCLWLGTSMGGAIGLRAAAGRLRGRIDRLILNDIGPEISAAAVERIRSYAGQPPSFATVRELAQYFRTIYAPFGTLSDAQWLHLTETSLRRLPDGRVTPHYDPQIVQQFIVHPHDYAQWPAWDSLSLPVLCLRGERSDLLLPEVTEQMKRRGPRADVITIPGCGHAPALHVPEQLALIDEFFSAKLVRSGGG
ncbi:MAG TPA: alpha/beta hydrolase [Pseudomonadota bacterium]|nr:alpha/beta hydrolase [Pseudomonadota bacterium]HND11205.1 alpha/beta hydrolase [Pseudomonadota bacterium]